MDRDPPPELTPDEMLSPEQFSDLARDLLRELARHDPSIEERLRAEGIDADG